MTSVSRSDPGSLTGEPRLVDDAVRSQLIARLTPGFTGQVIRPSDPGYDLARTEWNAMFDRHPGLIVRCAGTRDVVTAVNAARALGVAFSVRGGGHSVSGKTHLDGGMTIDLGPMRHVHVAPERQVAVAEGGCLLADMDEATQPHGLIVPSGTVSATGLGGLALGGGVGWFTRKHGLTCDNFLSLEVVLANGEIVEASPTQHPDLFRALRGGGGNFGIVTRFTLRAHRFGPLMRIGVSLYQPRDAEQALRAYASLAPTLPRTVGWHGTLKRHMPPLPFIPRELVGQRLLMLFSTWLDDADAPDGITTTERLTRVGNPCVTATTLLPFGTGMQKIPDAEFPEGHRNYAKQTPIDDLGDGVIDRLVNFWQEMPMRGEIQINRLGGALTDTPDDATAFTHRGAPWWIYFAMHWDEAHRDHDHIAEIRAAADSLAPWTSPGAYVNLLNTDEDDRIADAYGGPEKYAGLGHVKARYDPTNLFRVNHNIEPLPNGTEPSGSPA